MSNELIERFDDGLEDLELYGRHEDPGYKKLKALFPAIKAALSATLSPAHIEDGEAVEVVGTLIIGEQGWDNAIELNPGPVMALADAHPKSSMPLMTVAQHQRIVAALQSEVSRLKVMADNYFAIATDRHLEIASLKSEAALSAPPAGVPEDLREAVADAVAEALGEALDCTRVWSAWGVGTMSEDDFRQVADDPERVAEIADAAIAAMVSAAPTPPAAGTTSDKYRAELYDEVWQKARDMGYGNVTDALVELERIKAVPPAAGVPDGWKLIPAQPNEAMLNQVSPISGKEERLPYWWYQALIKSAPTPPASEQQRAVVMPERKPYPDPDGCSSNPEWWARKHEEAKSWNDCLAEFLRLNPHLAKGEGV